MSVRGDRVRLKDVAEHAGVSPKTVSNVLHQHRYVSTSTREKVEASLDALGYQVNLAARALASRRSGFIALAIPGLDNPYYAELAQQVMKAAAAQDWIVLIEQTRSAENLEREVVQGAGAQLVDGIILQPDAISREDLTARFAHRNLVLIGESDVTGSADHVAADPVTAARELVDLLISRGRKRIATIGIAPGDRVTASELRYRGLSQSLHAAGLPLPRELMRGVPRYRRPEGYVAAQELLALRERPDAIVCFNDLLAVGALNALRDAKVRVPEDIAVVGFDDNEESRFASPSLTSVAWDLESLARECVARLALRSASSSYDEPPARIRIGHTLQVRDSC